MSSTLGNSWSISHLSMPSAFVRKGEISRSLPGTTPCPSSPSVYVVSTGVPSFDDILGGGVPLGSACSILAPDTHSSWSRLISRYWISQGLADGHDVAIVAPRYKDGDDLVRGCMWVDGAAASQPDDSDGETLESGGGGGIKIAWRYDKMKRFQTTVGGQSALDLTRSLPEDAIERFRERGQLVHVDGSFENMLERVGSLISAKKVLRLVIHELASFEWQAGSSVSCAQFHHVLRSADEAQRTHRFLHALRETLRGTSAVAMITYADAQPDSVSSFSDGGCFSFQGFADDPSLSASFPHSHGLVHVHRLPSPGTLLPPAYKHSTLLGLGVGSSGQNNLAFRLKRRRFVIETLHLGVEGGVGERRTEPDPKHVHSHGVETVQVGGKKDRKKVSFMRHDAEGGGGAADPLDF